MATPATERAVDAAISALKQLLGPARQRRRRGPRASQPRRVVPRHRPRPTSCASPTRPTRSPRFVKISARRTGCRSFRSAPARRSKGTSTRSAAASRIDLREMNRVLRVSAEDLDATVEAGVTRLQLNKALRNTGLTFPVDPGADATIGGMAATRASGTTAVRYGTMRENVLGLTVVLADGRDHRDRDARAEVGGRLRPDAAVRRIRRHARRHHRSHRAAASAARSGVGGGLRVRLDGGRGRNGDRDDSARRFRSRASSCSTTSQMDAVNRYSKTSYPVAPTLFFEFHSDSERARRRAGGSRAGARRRARRPAISSGRRGSRIARRLWRARHDALYAALALRPGARAWTTDVCVPISRLAECIVETKQDNAGAPFPICARRPRRRRQLPPASTCSTRTARQSSRTRGSSTSGW